MMNWQTLFTTQRLGASGREQQDVLRGDFMRDYDRLIFSPHFRRLQNKTQVFPLSGSIFVHNRLTHTLEVASVGRSLGRAVGEKLAEKYASSWQPHALDFYRFELPSVIMTACLAHDIGNPPFGHSGEKAIRAFFTELDLPRKELIQSQLTENQWRDLTYFEGNANGFRLLTSLFLRNGLKLTHTSLASMLKYPADSANGFDKTTGWMATKKSGFMDAEAAYFEEVTTSHGMPALTPDGRVKARHPFVFLMEAADDLCYRIIDLEDAHQLNILSTNEIKDLLLPLFDEEPRTYLIGKLPTLASGTQQLAMLRAMLINPLITKCAEAFLVHEEALLAGTLQKPLIELLDADTVAGIKEIDRVSYQKIYKHPAVVEVEIAGYHVLGGLLNEYVSAVLYPDAAKSEMLLHILPPDYQIDTSLPLYNRLLGVLDYLSGMTDLEAIDSYRKITGIEQPRWRG